MTKQIINDNHGANNKKKQESTSQKRPSWLVNGKGH
jgi:hypothetical protein